jgi:predicted dehydrogenase
MVGFGFIAENGHLPAYAASKDLEIVAVADACAARREVAARALPDARIYADYGSMLAHEADDLDFLDVTTPPYVHAEIAHAGLDANLHVLCEKPLATSLADARSLLEHAARARRVIYPVQNYKHAPVIRAVREVLDAGLIGEVHQVTLSTYRSTHARGVKEWNEHWRREKRLSGGGIAMDHGSHTFYLAFEWLRGYPTAISAKMASTGGYDTEDLFVGTMTFPTGMASVHLSWTSGFRRVIYTIHGERGAVRVEDDDIEVSVRKPQGGWDTSSKKIASEWMDAGHSIWFQSMFEEFGQAIDRRDYVGRPAEDAFRCVELITAAYASAADGCRERRLGDLDVTHAPAPVIALEPAVPAAAPSKPGSKRRGRPLSVAG